MEYRACGRPTLAGRAFGGPIPYRSLTLPRSARVKRANALYAAGVRLSWHSLCFKVLPLLEDCHGAKTLAC
jgi:hypothetical protein